MNIVAIRAELAAALAGIGIPSYDHEPEKAEFPAAFVGFPDPVTYTPSPEEGGTYGGARLVEVQILVLVDRFESKYAQLRLAAAVSDVDTTDTIEGLVESGDATGIVIAPVRNALLAHTTSAWQSIHVPDASDYGEYQIAGDSGLGVVFTAQLRTH